MEQKKLNHDAVQRSKQEIKKDAKGLFSSLKKFLKELLDFREDTDYETTIEAIKADIPFKGATAWILIFAVFVASIGLNANSTAVVIGAMLISPLMGPILGIGMSFALNDIHTFKKSLVNLGTMIGLSLFASFLFFYLFPLSEDNSELLGRVRPDIRDVLIAFFGGLALMVARTKKGTVASVIFGVAIATALMPPLCTAGYGLAIGNFQYFFGAMYLFTINTIFIALATFLVLKLLRFPMHKYANAARRKRYATIAAVVGIAVMIPAVYTFIYALNDSRMNIQFKNYVKNEINSNPKYQLIDKNKITRFRTGIYKYIERRLKYKFDRDSCSDANNILLKSPYGETVMEVPKHSYGVGKWLPHVSICSTIDVEKNNQNLYQEIMAQNSDSKTRSSPDSKTRSSLLGKVDNKTIKNMSKNTELPENIKITWS